MGCVQVKEDDSHVEQWVLEQTGADRRDAGRRGRKGNNEEAMPVDMFDTLGGSTIDLRRRCWGLGFANPETESAFLTTFFSDRFAPLLQSSVVVPCNIFFLFTTLLPDDVAFGFLVSSFGTLLFIMLLLICLSIRKWTADHRRRITEAFNFASITLNGFVFGYANKAIMVSCAADVLVNRRTLRPNYECYRTIGAPIHHLIVAIIPIAPRLSLTTLAYTIIVVSAVFGSDQNH